VYTLSWGYRSDLRRLADLEAIHSSSDMLSKMVPRKSRGFETRVTENPKFQAPIPLYPEPGTRRDGVGGGQGEGQASQKPSSNDLAHLRKDLYPMDGSYGRGLLQVPCNSPRVHAASPVK